MKKRGAGQPAPRAFAAEEPTHVVDAIRRCFDAQTSDRASTRARRLVARSLLRPRAQTMGHAVVPDPPARGFVREARVGTDTSPCMTVDVTRRTRRLVSKQRLTPLLPDLTPPGSAKDRPGRPETAQAMPLGERAAQAELQLRGADAQPLLRASMSGRRRQRPARDRCKEARRRARRRLRWLWQRRSLWVPTQ